MKKLHIDIETYSSVDIKESGSYKYFESIDFEILLVAYAFDNDEVQIVDLTQGEQLPLTFLTSLKNPKIEKHAHNANFERNAFKAIGIDVGAEQWHCSAILAGYAGYPMSLKGASEAMGLGEKGKKDSGMALIRYFCVPVKPTKANDGRVRNLPHHDLEKWQEFKDYCIYDVIAEREIGEVLKNIKIPQLERDLYVLDQNINDNGIKVDVQLARRAVDTAAENQAVLINRMKELTGLSNPNSPAQLKEWLSNATGQHITTLAKDSVAELLTCAVSWAVREVLELRQKASKTSVKKYSRILNAVGREDRVRGLFQFYGANRTGRWAGRLVQLQNLPRNHMADLDLARNTLIRSGFNGLDLMYDDVGDTLSQLVRTALIPQEGNTFAVSDFSAIEARVLAWLAGEQWRLEVFATHGKIYEASASAMFNIPIEDIGKGSEYRQKGKIAELALGYGGAVGALESMGGAQMGLSNVEMSDIVKKWRVANPKIAQFWYDIDDLAKNVVALREEQTINGITLRMEDTRLSIELPIGRKLYYNDAKLMTNRFGGSSIFYKGTIQTTGQWGLVDTYGGKLTENIVQAIARDLLAESMLALDGAGFDIVASVHDEVIAEIPSEGSGAYLTEMEAIMGITPEWAKGLVLTADGYTTDYYKKD